jgi:hypothetical protein
MVTSGGTCRQVPQMLLEEAWGAGRGARIMCTQPRRISAVSVAERIAQERAEQIGDNIGYTIRLDTKYVTALHPQQLVGLRQPPIGICTEIDHQLSARARCLSDTAW